MIKEDIESFIKVDENTMKLEYENFAEVLSRPKPEKRADNAFTRNAPAKAGEEGAEEDDKQGGGFEKRQVTRGGGFIQRGRGRGRGQ